MPFEFTLRLLGKVEQGQGVCLWSKGANKSIHKSFGISASDKAVHDKPEKKVNLHSLS